MKNACAVVMALAALLAFASSCSCFFAPSLPWSPAQLGVLNEREREIHTAKAGQTQYDHFWFLDAHLILRWVSGCHEQNMSKTELWCLTTLLMGSIMLLSGIWKGLCVWGGGGLKLNVPLNLQHSVTNTRSRTLPQLDASTQQSSSDKLAILSELAYMCSCTALLLPDADHVSNIEMVLIVGTSHNNKLGW